MSDAPLGIPRELCVRLSGMDYGAFEALCLQRINRDKEALSQRKVSEEDSSFLRGQIAAHRDMMRLGEQVTKTLQADQK